MRAHGALIGRQVRPMGYKYYMITLGCTPPDRSAFHTTRFLHHRIFRGFGERSEPTPYMGFFTAGISWGSYGRDFHGRDFHGISTAGIFTAGDFTGFLRPGFVRPRFHEIFTAAFCTARFSTGFSRPRFLRPRFFCAFGRISRDLYGRDLYGPIFRGCGRAERAHPF